MEPPRLPTWQIGLSASSPVQPAASIENEVSSCRQCRFVPVWKKKLMIGGAAPMSSAARPETSTARRPTSDCWKFWECTPERPGGGADEESGQGGDERPRPEAVGQVLQRPAARQRVHARVERDVGQMPHDHGASVETARRRTSGAALRPENGWTFGAGELTSGTPCTGFRRPGTAGLQKCSSEAATPTQPRLRRHERGAGEGRRTFAPHAPALSYWGRAAEWAGGSQSEPDPGDPLHRDRGRRLRPRRRRGGPAGAALGAAGHLPAPRRPRHPAGPRPARGRVQHRDLARLPGAGDGRRRPGGHRVELRRHPPAPLPRHPDPGRRPLRRERHRDLPQRPGQRPDGQPPR